MSAQVTEAHLELAKTVIFSRDASGRLLTAPMAAQLIADSEARACDQLRAEVATCNDALEGLVGSLRVEVERWELAFQEQYARAASAEREVERLKPYVSKAVLTDEGTMLCSPLVAVKFNEQTARAERAEDELLAVKMELDQAACARTDGILRESDLQCALNMEREKVKRLTTALKDAISTYDHHRKETLVTAERQETWIAALKGDAK